MKGVGEGDFSTPVMKAKILMKERYSLRTTLILKKCFIEKTLSIDSGNIYVKILVISNATH